MTVHTRILRFLLLSHFFLLFACCEEDVGVGENEEECSWRFKKDPENCDQFFMCNFGQSLSLSCPTGLYWNAKVDACDWKNNVKCRTTKLGEMSNEIEEDDELKAACEDNTFQAHPSDCGKYYHCVHGSPVEQQCTPPLQWNSAVSACDWPQNVQCTGSGGIETGAGPGPAPPSGITVPPPIAPSVGPPAPPPDGGEGGGGGPPAPPPPSPTNKPRPTTSSPSGGGSTDPTIVGIITGPVTPPSDEGAEEVSDVTFTEPEFKVICYFTDWSWYRQGEGKFMPKDVDPELCTHYVYAFGILDSNDWTIRPADSWADLDNKFYEQMTSLKKKGKKVTIALGGWNDSGGQKYSMLLRDPKNIQSLITSVVKFVKEHDFDGIDLDYEYPSCPQGTCNSEYATDKKGFTLLVKGLRAALPKGSIVSAAVSPNRDIIKESYEVAEIADSLDWIGVMGYDMHGSWDKVTGHIAPLYQMPDDTKEYFNVDYAIKYWMEKGAPAHKIVMGVPLYGQSFTLQNNSVEGLNAPIMGPGEPGTFTRSGGILSYYEICSRNWTQRVEDDKGRMGPYVISGNQWVSYDDVSFIQKKMNYVKQNGLGGTMAWALDFDDFNNRCGGGRYPLLNAIKNSFIFK